ncbi:MAG: hypothetical protein ABS76_15635 [Pelagibacterium sp. SCN 64-44]|nr:MAG: hypothetical protein ABS76_15635 [Pelagibacterium sp. SCN 64-44]
MQLPFTINLLPDGTVVHQDGEYLGTWHIDDETDAFYLFVPDGADEALLMDTNKPGLSKRIEEWYATRP